MKLFRTKRHSLLVKDDKFKEVLKLLESLGIDRNCKVKYISKDVHEGDWIIYTHSTDRKWVNFMNESTTKNLACGIHIYS